MIKREIELLYDEKLVLEKEVHRQLGKLECVDLWPGSMTLLQSSQRGSNDPVGIFGFVK